MNELPPALVRSLRAGPIDELEYLGHPIGDPLGRASPVGLPGPTVERVAGVTRSRLRDEARPPRAWRWAALTLSTLVVGVVVGRLTAPVAPGGPASSMAPLVQPAHVDDGLSTAWARSTLNLNESLVTAMVCIAQSALACQTTFGTDLGPATNSARTQGLPPTVPVETYWGRLHPLTVPAGHLAGAFAVPAVAGSFDVRLMRLGSAAGDAGVEVDVVSLGDPGEFFDLGAVAPGSYALVIATNPTAPGSELLAVGLSVAGS